jgi:hypothetical protein
MKAYLLMKNEHVIAPYIMIGPTCLVIFERMNWQKYFENTYHLRAKAKGLRLMFSFKTRHAIMVRPQSESI